MQFQLLLYGALVVLPVFASPYATRTGAGFGKEGTIQHEKREADPAPNDWKGGASSLGDKTAASNIIQPDNNNKKGPVHHKREANPDPFWRTPGDLGQPENGKSGASNINQPGNKKRHGNHKREAGYGPGGPGGRTFIHKRNEKVISPDALGTGRSEAHGQQVEKHSTPDSTLQKRDASARDASHGGGSVLHKGRKPGIVHKREASIAPGAPGRGSFIHKRNEQVISTDAHGTGRSEAHGQQVEQHSTSDPTLQKRDASARDASHGGGSVLNIRPGKGGKPGIVHKPKAGDGDHHGGSQPPPKAKREASSTLQRTGSASNAGSLSKRDLASPDQQSTMLTQLQACMKDISCFSLMFKPVSTASTGTGNPTFNTVNSVSSGVLAGETPAFNNVALTNVENTGDGSVGNGNTNTQENGQESEVPGPPLSTPVPDASQPVQPVSDPTPQPSVNPQGIYTSRNTIPPATVPAAQPDPQQTPSPQPATASNSTADPVVSRRGLALDPNMPAEAIAKFNDHISFYYSWTMVSQSQQYTTAEFWPQMKAGNATQIARSSQELGTLLGFNEPNQPGQNLVSAADAALVYNAFFEQYKGTIKTITTPAPSNAADGLQYLKDFKTACTHAKCQELQVTAHFYGEDINFLQKQINQMCHDLGPIWITELGFTKWSGPLDAATVQALQKEMIEWLDHPDQAKCVTKYAFLASTSDPNLGEVNSGLTASGDLTALGRYLTTGQWS